MQKKLILGLVLVLMSRNVYAACDKAGDQINVNCWDCAADDGISTCEARLTGTTLTVSGTGEMKDYERVDYRTGAPWGRIGVTDLVVENGITVLGDRSFENMKTIQKVKLPPTLQSIGKSSFFDVNLEEIEIPDSVKILDEFAFAINNLKELVLPEGLQKLSWYALASTQIRSLVIPSSVTTLSMIPFGRNTQGYKVPPLETLYCTAAQMSRCQEALEYAESQIKPTRYEKEGNNYLVYDDKGNVVGKYVNITALNKGTATETYKYDSAGHLTSIFDGNGQRTWGKKIYTVEEAMESTAKGDRFHVYLTYK